MQTKAPSIDIGSLYPELTPEEQKRAEDNLSAYLRLVVRIYNRISADPVALAQLRAALDSERSTRLDDVF